MEWFKNIIEKSYDENGSINIEILVKEFDKEFSKNAVSKIKYDEALKEIQEKDNQIKELEGVEVEKLKAEVESLKNNEKEIIKNNAIEMALIKAGAKNLKATKALIQLDDEFNEEELKKQIESLTQGEDSSFLFEKNTGFFGSSPEESSGSLEKSFDEMSYSEMCAVMNNR